MRLIKKYDVFVPGDEIDKVIHDRAGIVDLMRAAFKLGREAEQMDKAEEAVAKEGGTVHSV